MPGFPVDTVPTSKREASAASIADAAASTADAAASTADAAAALDAVVASNAFSVTIVILAS